MRELIRKLKRKITQLRARARDRESGPVCRIPDLADEVALLPIRVDRRRRGR